MSNEIALAQVQQIQMLRQLVMAMMNSQNTAAANQLNSQTQSQLAAQAIHRCTASPGLQILSTAPSPRHNVAEQRNFVKKAQNAVCLRFHRYARAALLAPGNLPAARCTGTTCSGIHLRATAEPGSPDTCTPPPATTVNHRRTEVQHERPMNLDSIATQFYTAGVHYSAAIQPYALKLFFALFLIDIIVTWIQYTAEGQLDPSFFLGRMIKHVLSGGFIYLMIVNGFSWMYAGHPELLAHRRRDQRSPGAQSRTASCKRG